MHSKSWMILLVLVLFLLNGCEEKKQEEKQVEVNTAGNIVVTKGVVKALKKEDNSKENSGQFYYSYNKEKKDENNSDDAKTRTELDAYRDIRSPYESVQITLMITQLSPDYHLLCSACHDDYANGVVGPALLDKNATYIYDRIIAFKTGKKDNPLMKELVNRIDDKRLQSIAKEIERFNKEIQEMRTKR